MIFAHTSSGMVIGTTRRGGLGFVTDPQRLNMAIKRAVEVFFIVADVKALSKQPLVSKAVEAGDELEPENKNQNLEILETGRKALQDILKYYIEQGCLATEDIETLSQQHVSFKEATDFATAMQNQKCYKCQELGHIKAQCPNEEKPRPPKQVKCNECGGVGHKRAKCPERRCKRCNERGHLKAACPKKLTCTLCGQRGHLVDQCPEGPAEFPEVKW